MTPSAFQTIQPFIDQWEGGYVDHPLDPGGPTNMGITQGTLTRWRGAPASRDDVRALTRSEAWKIMRAHYYDVVHGDDLPPPVALMVYNAAVLSGPKRAARFLQQAVGRLGVSVAATATVDAETLRAVAQVAPRALALAFADVQEAYLRSLTHFATFGAGWMRRLNAARTLAKTLPLAPAVDDEAAPDETRGTIPAEENTALTATLNSAQIVLGALAKPAPDGARPAHAEALAKIGAALDILRNPTVAGAIAKLGPVNSALGERIGRFLNGKKTAIGLIGSVLTALVAPAPAATAPAGLYSATQSLQPALVKLFPVLEAVAAVTPGLQPVFLALTAWGILGKMEKWASKPSP